MSNRLGLVAPKGLPGDGIGPEIVTVAVDVAKAAAERVDLDPAFDYDEVGSEEHTSERV